VKASPAPRRRRAALLLSLALACGGLAASEVSSRIRDVEARVGSQVPAVVAVRDLEPGRELRASDLAVRAVPERFVPPDSLAAAGEATGSAVAVRVARGSYLTGSALGAGAGGPGGRRPGALRRGERAVEVGVSGRAAGLAESAVPGGRVDVLVSTEPRDGAGRTFLALENVELLDLAAADGDGAAGAPSGGEGDRPTATATATLRVTLRQAVYLTAAQNFAREVRLLPRPAGDGGRTGRAAVRADGL
jgi:pilus assembly protein CpaB